jgi:hypothetical protein
MERFLWEMPCRDSGQTDWESEENRRRTWLMTATSIVSVADFMGELNRAVFQTAHRDLAELFRGPAIPPWARGA